MNQATILVVDDDPFFRNLYQELLNGSHYLVTVTESGAEAMRRLGEGGVDVVLAELQMADLGGLDLLRYTRTLDNPPDVILTTDHATLETAIEALKSGARDYLIKPFKPEELQHLIRTCIEQRRLLDENIILKSQIRLFQRGQNIASLLEIDRLLPLAVSTLLGEFGHGRGFAFLTNGDEITKIYGSEGTDDSKAFALAEALLPQFRELGSLKVLHGEQLPSLTNGPQHLSTVCLYPLTCERSFKGGVVLCNPSDGDFAIHPPLENILFLAEQTALGFENAFRYQGARELIYTDDLTGLFNYRYLQIVLDQEIRRTERYGLSFSLIFIDLDHFKEINDTHGHLVGSELLRELAELLRKGVREVDTLFRYGGDEFTALLVETDAAGAAIVAERIRKSIETYFFLERSAGPTRLTATIGYATFPANATTKQSILDMADRAMYDGKRQRNVVRGAWEISKT